MLALVVAMLLTSAWMLQLPRRGVIPELPIPPAVPPELLNALSGSAELTIRDVHFTTSAGARVDLPLIEIKPRFSQRRDARQIHLESVRLVGLRIVAPIDTVHTGIDPFLKIPGPRITIDRVSIIDADVGELADPALGLGRWMYHNRDIDVELRNIDIGGDRSSPEVIQLTRFDMLAESKGIPAQITRAAGTVRRTPNRFDVRGAAGFGLTEVGLTASFARGGGWTADIIADTIRFPELRAFAPSLPREGEGKLSLAAAKNDDDLSVNFRQASAQFGESRISLRGRITTGAAEAAQGLTLQLDNLRSEDMKSAFDVELPGDGPYSGRITASGALRDGVRVNGGLTGSAAGKPSSIAVNGLVKADPDAVLDLEIRGDPIRLADTAFVARLIARGPLNELGITGTIRLREAATPVTALTNGALPAPLERLRSPSVELDVRLSKAAGAARQLSGKAAFSASRIEESTSVHALVEGVIVLAKEKTVSARLTADSLPLELLPLPSSVENVRGFLRADVRVEGALDRPDLKGGVDIRDGAAAVRTGNVEVTGINGHLGVAGQRVVVDSVTAHVRDGLVRITGDAFVVGDDRRINLAVTGQRIRLIADSEKTTGYLADLSARVSGPLDSARASGTVHISEAGTNRMSGTVTGSVLLAKPGALDVEVNADSLPIETMPFPKDRLDELSGHVRGRVAIKGTFDDPQINGTLHLVDAGARIPRSGTRLTGLGGDLRIENGIAHADLRGVAGVGTLALTGTAELLGDRKVDLQLRADSATLANMDSAKVIASAGLRITGVINEPYVQGKVRLVGGWVKEDLMLRNRVIDPEDPPYAALAARVPWRSDSPLLKNVRRGPASPPPFRGSVSIEVNPAIKMIDEDSELFGVGDVLLTADSLGLHTTGGIKFEGGFYTNYGERFRVFGGGFRLSNAGETMIAVRSEHERDRLGGRNFGTSSPLDWYPGLEILAHGIMTSASEQIRRLSLLRESQTELAALLIYDEMPEPVTGFRNRRFWLADEPSDLIGEQTEAQGGALLWSYIADELYDYLPLSRAGLRGGTVTIGSRFPGRIVQGPLFRARATIGGGLELHGSWATEGSSSPGVRAQFQRGHFYLMAFSEPKFFAAISAGGGQPGYFHRRRTGVGIRFDNER